MSYHEDCWRDPCRECREAEWQIVEVEEIRGDGTNAL